MAEFWNPTGTAGSPACAARLGPSHRAADSCASCGAHGAARSRRWTRAPPPADGTLIFSVRRRVASVCQILPSSPAMPRGRPRPGERAGPASAGSPRHANPMPGRIPVPHPARRTIGRARRGGPSPGVISTHARRTRKPHRRPQMPRLRLAARARTLVRPRSMPGLRPWPARRPAAGDADPGRVSAGTTRTCGESGRRTAPSRA